MRRTALLAALLAACAPKPIRPTPDVELVQATPIGAGHGLLIFKDPSPLAHPRYHLARHGVDGQLQWQRPLTTRDVPETNERLAILGDAALIPISTGSIVPSDSFLHLRLADGAVTRWTPRGDLGEHHPDTAVVGDERQIFVAWLRGDLEISAFDPTTGELQWTFTTELPARILPRLRLGERHLLFADPTGEWQQLDRTDGARARLPDLDARSNLCTVAGRRWAHRDEHILSMGDDGVRQAVATFIPPALRHQWTLVDCAATRDGQVVLAVNIDPTEAGMLVGIDPETLAPRWDVKLSYPLTTRSVDGSDAWPPVVGDTVLADQRGDACFVAVDAARVRWCTHWEFVESWYHGDDFILAGYPLPARTGLDPLTGAPPVDSPDALHLVRVRGSDGEVVAAATIHSDRLRARDVPRTRALPGDHLWFTLPESDLLHHGKLPLLLLDARTLRPVPPTPGRADFSASVEDALPNLAAVFPTTRRPHIAELDLLRATESSTPRQQNPWDAVFHAHGSADPAAAPLTAKHRQILAAARKAADLPAELELRPLAWCEDRVVAVARQRSGPTTRWTLIKGRQGEGDPYALHTRAHDRPLAAIDLDRFLLLDEYRLVSADITPCAAPGTIDEDAWRSVTSEPRTHTWALRVPTTDSSR